MNKLTLKPRIEASIITDIINSFKSLSQKLGKVLDTMVDLGTKLVDSEQDGDSNIVTMETPEGNIVKAKITPTSSTNKFDILFMDKSGTKIKEYNNVIDDEFDDKYYEVVLDKFGEDLAQPNTASDESITETTKFKVGFKKIISDNEEIISYTKVFGCTNGQLVLSDINALMSDDAFVQSIPLDIEQYYAVEDKGSDILVEECGEATPSDSYETLLSTLIPAYSSLLTLHWNVYGDEFYSIHTELNDICYQLQYNIDTIAELAVQNCKFEPHFGHYIEDINVTDYTCKSVANVAQTILHNVITVIELTYDNFSCEVQSILDNMLNMFKVVADYKLAQYLK